jgi:hypothetical protein
MCKIPTDLVSWNTNLNWWHEIYKSPWIRLGQAGLNYEALFKITLIKNKNRLILRNLPELEQGDVLFEWATAFQSCSIPPICRQGKVYCLHHANLSHRSSCFLLIQVKNTSVCNRLLNFHKYQEYRIEWRWSRTPRVEIIQRSKIMGRCQNELTENGDSEEFTEVA